MMASCKDCLHVDVCRGIYLAIISGEINSYEEFLEKCEKEHFEKQDISPCNCLFYKGRSRFVELHHAEWVEDEDMYGDPIYRCSNCNEHFVLEEGTPTDNCYSYCPNCGAKMDEPALKEREENAN